MTSTRGVGNATGNETPCLGLLPNVMDISGHLAIRKRAGGIIHNYLS